MLNISSRHAIYVLMFVVLLVRGAESPEPPAREARVMVARNMTATVAFNPDPAQVAELFSKALLAWTSEPTLTRAWRKLMSTQEIVGIKVFSSPGATSG